MGAIASKVLADALELPTDERAELALHVLRSLHTDAGQDPPEAVELAWAREIDRDVAELDAGRMATRPAEDVMRDLDARLQARGAARRR